MRRHAARVAVEDGFVGLYFHGHNTRVYRELEEPHHIDFALEAAPALEAVLNAYPKYVTVARLPADNDAMPHGMQQLPPGDPVLSLQLTEDRVLTSHGGKHWTARIWDLDSLDAPSPGPRIGG